MPHLSQAYRKYHKQGFEIVSVSLDNDHADLKRFIAARKMTWRHVHDADGRLARQFGVSGIPFTLLLGRDGVIRAVNAEGPALDAAIRAAVGQPRSASKRK